MNPTLNDTAAQPVRIVPRQAATAADGTGRWSEDDVAALFELPFADGETIPLRGVPHRIAHRPGARGTVWTESGDENLICVAGRPAVVKTGCGSASGRFSLQRTQYASITTSVFSAIQQLPPEKLTSPKYPHKSRSIEPLTCQCGR